MEREGSKDDVDIEVGPQTFNTYRTEIAPRSDVVRKDFEDE
jgi:hypothetical protein